MSIERNPSLRCLVVLLVALVQGLLLGRAWGAEVKKVFELDDGTDVVGVVVDESETGYLVRTSSGEVVRVEYSQIRRVTALGSSIEQDGQGPKAHVPPLFELRDFEIEFRGV